MPCHCDILLASFLILLFALVVVEDFTLYGHLSTFGSYIKDILIIIITGGTGKPEARVIIFKNHSDGFNRLYFFNAMQNYRHPQKGNTCSFYLTVLFYCQMHAQQE